MTTQELFDIAKGNYKEARALIAKVNEISNKGGAHLNLDFCYRALDVTIQYMLLETALADGKFSPIEGKFIDKITDSSDVTMLPKKVFGRTNWEWFATHKNFSQIKKAVGKLGSKAQERMKLFAQQFALVDLRNTNMDMLGTLLEILGKITGCFTRIDGSHDECEVNVAINVLAEYFVEPWVETKDHAKK